MATPSGLPLLPWERWWHPEHYFGASGKDRDILPVVVLLGSSDPATCLGCGQYRAGLVRMTTSPALRSTLPRGALAGHAVVGMAWAYPAHVAGRAFVLVATAILARLLTPADFCGVAVALVAIGLFDLVPELGLSSALVVTRDDELEERAGTVFALVLSVSATMTVIVAALAPVAAAFFSEHNLGAVIRAIAPPAVAAGGMVLALLTLALAVDGALVTAAVAVSVDRLTYAALLGILAREALTKLHRWVVTRGGVAT